MLGDIGMMRVKHLAMLWPRMGVQFGLAIILPTATVCGVAVRHHSEKDDR